jgi:hypothetical protein
VAGGGRVGDHVQHSITSHTHLDESIGQFDDTAAERWSALSVDPATSVLGNYALPRSCLGTAPGGSVSTSY